MAAQHVPRPERAEAERRPVWMFPVCSHRRALAAARPRVQRRVRKLRAAARRPIFGGMIRRPAPLAAALSALVLLAVAGCASPTPYRPGWTGDGYGYGEQRIEDNRYRVSFTGNGATPRETVQNYLLYRAAELTLAQGADWFVVAARSTSPDYGGGGSGVSTGVGVGGGSRSGVGVGLGIGLPLGGGGGGPVAATSEIVIHRGAKPETLRDAFDARAVRQNLGPRILRG